MQLIYNFLLHFSLNLIQNIIKIKDKSSERAFLIIIIGFCKSIPQFQSSKLQKLSLMSIGHYELWLFLRQLALFIRLTYKSTRLRYNFIIIKRMRRYLKGIMLITLLVSFCVHAEMISTVRNLEENGANSTESNPQQPPPPQNGTDIENGTNPHPHPPPPNGTTPPQNGTAPHNGTAPSNRPAPPQNGTQPSGGPGSQGGSPSGNPPPRPPPPSNTTNSSSSTTQSGSGQQNPPPNGGNRRPPPRN